MKRSFIVAASFCALVLALAAGPAFAKPPSPPGTMIPEAGGQSNTAILSNVPVLSGNSVAGYNGGDQTSSADPTLTQTNGGSDGSPPPQPPTGTTDQAQPTLVPQGPTGPDGNGGSGGESNTAVLSNDPVASGNSVALINGGGCNCDGGNQTSSADPTLTQTNAGSSDSQDNYESKSSDGCRCSGDKQGDDKSNRGDKNVAILSNDPVASGNSVALINTGDQSSSADPTLTQTNSGGKSKGGDKNIAILSNDPVASGNSVALINTGNQSSSADPTLTQTNSGDTSKSGGYDQKPGPKSEKPCPKPEPKPCPKPEPKPCPEPKPKPCPEPKPKPCPEPKPNPCQQKPCPPKPCEPQPCASPVGLVTNTVKHLL